MSQEINLSRRRFLGATAMAIAAAQIATPSFAKTGRDAGAGARGPLASLAAAPMWLNSQPLNKADLIGKVVLVNFWTYSCINWRRQLPYVRAWEEKYKDKGLLVIGVHTPEFSFEKNIDNVRWAIKDMNVNFPVVLDNDYVIWRAFENEYWPALYFIDPKGHIAHNAFGEGKYEESEAFIQRLLRESRHAGIPRDPVSVYARGAEAAADWHELESSENYVGYQRTEYFASGGIKRDEPQTYTTVGNLQLNQWGVFGNWTFGKEAIVLNEPNGRILYRFHARDLHLVMGPSATKTPVRFQVAIDEQQPRNSHGVDVDEQGNGTVVEPRMYQLIRQISPISDRQFEIRFLDSGVQAFSFTFG